MIGFTGGGKSHMQIDTYTGLDAWLLPILPRPIRLRVIAAKIRRHHSLAAVPPGGYTFTLPGETLVYELAEQGVRPFRPKAL